MKRWLFFAYGVVCHVLFLVTYGYMALWVGALLLPNTIDSAKGAGLPMAIITNLALMAMFAIQHSVMARPAFKRAWTRIIPKPIERSTYVLISCLAVIILMWQWQGIDLVIWEVQNHLFRRTLWGLFVAGWLLVPLVSLVINHFDLFGTRQVWFYLRGKEYEPLQFRVPIFYRSVRHPLYLAWALAFWATPNMNLGHLLFAGVLTVYMVGAAVIEERDLVAHFGDQYRKYQGRVPMFVPQFVKLKETRPVGEVTHTLAD